MKYLSPFFFFFLIQSTQAQWSFKIAYDDTYFKPSKINAILEDYNKNNVNANTNFKPLVHLTGIEMGVRFRQDFISLEGGWTTHFTTKSQYNWTDASRNTRQRQSISLNKQTFNGGLTLHLGTFGIGASYDYNYFNMGKKFIGQARRAYISDKSFEYNSVTLFMQYEAKMTRVMHFAIRPYVQIPLKNATYSTLTFRDAVNPKSDLTFTDGFGQDLNFVGIKFIFFNGKQHNDN